MDVIRKARGTHKVASHGGRALAQRRREGIISQYAFRDGLGRRRVDNDMRASSFQTREVVLPRRLIPARVDAKAQPRLTAEGAATAASHGTRDPDNRTQHSRRLAARRADLPPLRPAHGNLRPRERFDAHFDACFPYPRAKNRFRHPPAFESALRTARRQPPRRDVARQAA